MFIGIAFDFRLLSPIHGMVYAILPLSIWCAIFVRRREICSKNALEAMKFSVLFSHSCDVYHYDNDDGTPKHLSRTKDVRLNVRSECASDFQMVNVVRHFVTEL